MSRDQPPALKRELRRRVSSTSHSSRKSRKFIHVLVQEAVNCEVCDHDNYDKVPKKLITQRPSPSQGNGSGGKGTSSDKPATTKKKIPICMWPRHKKQGVWHYLRDCRECQDEEKDKLHD